MASTGLVVAIVILFILVTVAIVLAIVALVYTTDNSVPFNKVVVSNSNGADNKTVNVTNTTFIYYKVGANSTLTLKGKEGSIAIVRNDSIEPISVTIIPENKTTFNVPIGSGSSTNSLVLSGQNRTGIVVWKTDTTAVASFI